MSKTSIRSRNSIQSLIRQKKKKKETTGNKNFEFCCATGDYDPLARYDQRNPPFKSSLTAITSIHECPVLKIRTHFVEHNCPTSTKKGYKIQPGSATDLAQWTTEKKHTSAPGTLLKYLEDEVDFSIFKNTQEKKQAYEEEGKKNIILGKKKVKAEVIKHNKSPLPRWYQDYSNEQMKHLMILKEALCADYEENSTYRTQQILLAIGIISAVFKLSPNIITNLQQKSNRRPVDFLRETYKIKTGVDFEDEGYKNRYNCNERLILSGIAFLTLPETIIELNERLPSIETPEYPPKPLLPHEYPEKMDCPYKEKLFQPPDFRLYRVELYKWRKKMELIPKPKVILPPQKKTSVCYENPVLNKENEKKIDRDFKEISFHNNEEKLMQKNKNEKYFLKKNSNKEEAKQKDENHNENSKSNKEQFGFSLSGLGDGAGPVQYKICGTLDPLERNLKYWLGEKDLHYVISGIMNEDEPPQGPVTYELTGLAKVTPNNSNDDFFAKLKLGDGPKKIYPHGRQYLSKNWLEWLQNVDEEFLKAEKKANKLIESVQATMRLVVPGPTCDSCCACRQTKKSNLKKHTTKTPHMIIDSIAEDDNNKRYIVGSMSMQSAPPSLAESTVNLLEVVASHDKISKNLLINGITNDDGQTIYYISGVTKDIEHIPEEKIKEVIPKSIKNVPPCACAIDKIFNEGLDQEPSNDNIPVAKDGTCCGKTYRPKDGPAYSCKQYPNDKSCKRNPFFKSLQEHKKNAKMQKVHKDLCPPTEQNMCSLPDFQPRVDLDGMADCEGPWETKVPQPEPPKKDDEDKEEIDEEEDGIFHEESVWNKCGEEIDWDARRTAPSVKEVQSIYEKGLSLTQPQTLTSQTLQKYKNYPETEPKQKRDKRDERNKESEKSTKQIIAKKGYENKKLIVIKNKEDSKRPINYRVLQQSLVDNRETNGDGKSKFNRSIEQNVDKNIKSKRLVKSAKKPPTARRNVKIDTSKDNRKRGMHKLTSLTNSYKKLSALKKPKSPKESPQNYMKKTENLAKHTTSFVIQSKYEKLQQLKDDMQQFKNLPVMKIQTVVIPEQKSESCKRDTKYEDGCLAMQYLPGREDKILNKEGPFGWRTESEQKLEPQKTLIYLTEATYPIENVSVRPGGKACDCRENRNKKKILKYSIGGSLNKVEEKTKKVQNVTQIIEGLTYITPPPSPRRSDEYIPEYELYESPYHTCQRKNTDDALKLTEKFLGTQSLMSKNLGNKISCSCGSEDISNEIYSSEKQKEILEKELSSENATNEWHRALTDAGLMDFLAGNKNDIPCWVKCSQFSKSGCSDNIRKLQVKKPVCECKYERKIVQRNEAKQKWLERQERLKSYKKTPFTNIGGISRPMEADKRFIISGVKRIPIKEGDDEVKYCVSGVAENYKMGHVQYLIDGVHMQTPLVTPKPSEKQVSGICAHKHWSVTELPKSMTSFDMEEVENWQGIKENQLNDKPKRLNDATKCKKLANMKEVSNFKRNFQVEDEITNNKKNKFLKTKRRKMDDVNYKNVTQESSNPRYRNLNKSEAQSLLQNQDPEPEQLVSKVEVKQKKVKKYVDDKLALSEIVENKLREMATEGFIFAKLPRCYKMPQIKYWIMYRKGALLTDENKEKIMKHSLKSWRNLEAIKYRNIKPPPMDLTGLQMQNLNFNKAVELKNQSCTSGSSKKISSIVEYNGIWKISQFIIQRNLFHLFTCKRGGWTSFGNLLDI
ncbi:uncharacterized protein LOC117167622 isoform X2 [Belonocnema kinseyi]|uniref:uncharacterized protein LOC117167622 isoform X2 n=1 Tax=Belonocnema kinseyi TaxID=2817044 RepID=UPI00143D0772|nr:uncharacterized protein LOC117167622 isoform X2 [Belonocnema kinseyi]